MEFRDDTEHESTPQLSDSVPEGDEHAEREAPQPAAYSYVCQIEACATTLITAYDKVRTTRPCCWLCLFPLTLAPHGASLLTPHPHTRRSAARAPSTAKQTKF